MGKPAFPIYQPGFRLINGDELDTSFQQVVRSVDSITELRTLTPSALRPFQQFAVSNIGGGLIQFYYWDAASTAADNGSTVIKPDAYVAGDPGRYLLIGVTAGATSSIATSGTPVSISGTAPTAGQVLTATSPTTATWQPSSGETQTGTTGVSNTSYGQGAGTSVTTGTTNTTAGVNAGNAITTGQNNVAVGFEALKRFQNNLGLTFNNTAVGAYALTSATTGYQNTALGEYALTAVTLGSANVGVGNSAGAGITTGGSNVAIAKNALSTLSTGSNNVAIGDSALQSATTSRFNIAIGTDALVSNTTGEVNTVGGHVAMSSLSGASHRNTAWGANALFNLSLGSDSTAVGESSLYWATVGGQTAVGSSCLLNVTTGQRNVGVGYLVGAGGATPLTTGSDNTLFGDQAQVNSANAQNRVVIGSGAVGTLDNSVQLGNSNVTVVSMNGDGSSVRNFQVNRQTTAATAGAAVALQAGAAVLGGTNLAGGLAVVSAGLGTGNALTASVELQGPNLNTASGTADQATINRLVAGHSKIVSNGVSKSFFNVILANGTSAGGTLHYGVEVFDGTNIQIETGSIVFSAICSTGGVVTNNVVTKFGNQQAALSGTLTVTWSLSATAPSVLSVVVSSTLTPLAGYPRVSTSMFNCTNQAVTRDVS